MKRTTAGAIWVMASVAIVAGQAGPGAPAESARRHDELGIAAGDAGRLDEAIAAFRHALRVDPAYAPAHFHLGLALERSGRPRDALAPYQEALRLQPDLFEARFGLSSVCAQLGDLDGAIALLRQVVAAMPDAAEPRYNLGLHLWNRYKRSTGLRRSEDLDAAVEEIAVAARLAPMRPDTHAALGQLLADRQQLDAAAASLRKAVALSPDNAGFAYDLGLVLRSLGDLDSAESLFRDVLRRSPRHGHARRALGLVLRQKGDLTGAAVELQAAVALMPDDAQAQHLLGSVLLKTNREAALAALYRAAELDPDSTETRVMLAQALARAGRTEEASRAQADVEAINAENAALSRAMMLVETAAASAKRGDVAGAITQLQEAAVEVSPTFAEAHHQLALALLSDPGRAASAEAHFLRVVQLDPEHAAAHHRLGVLRARRGDLQGALASLRRATELRPGLIDAHRELAALAWKADDWTTVLASLGAVVAWEPGDARAHYAISRALRHLGRTLDAERELTIARRLDPSIRDPR